MSAHDERLGRWREVAPWLAGGGEIGRLMRSTDWAKTALGPVESWPQSLRSAVSILLPSKAPIVMFWGPELVALYNDAYAPTIGAKHPSALGRPARENWSELWDTLEPLLLDVVRTGEAFRGNDYPLVIERHGYLEEVFFDVSYDPVRGETGAVAGVFCIVSETTGRVLGERRLRTLRDLGSKTASEKSVDAVCKASAAAMSTNPADIPFALLYLLDAASKRAKLAAATGVDVGHPAAPASVDFTGGQTDAAGPWPLARAAATGLEEIHGLELRLGAIGKGGAGEPVRSALVLALRSAVHQRTAGLLVFGLNPRCKLDEEYREFLKLVAHQTATAIANTHAYEEERGRAETLVLTAGLAGSHEPAVPRDGSRILVADDNAEMREYLSRLLQPHWEVDVVGDGQAALTIALARPPALVLTEVMMPRMDGVALLRALRADPRTASVPVVLLSARAGEEAVLEGLETGADDYLVKPFSARELVTRVRTHVGMAQRVRRAAAEAAKELAETRAALLEEIDAKNKELEAFSYSVAHDLRAPLRAIAGFSAALVENLGDKLDGEARGYLDRICAGAARMGELIDALLSLSRVSRADIAREDVNLTKIANAAIKQLRASDPARRVEFVVADGLAAHGDPRLLRVLLDNLLGNAWKFASKREAAHIEFGRAQDKGISVYFVRDNGAGFDPAYAGKLFAPFQRLHSDKEFSGTGIGLATVHRIVDRHGGRVWAEGAVDQGATFYFTLRNREQGAL